MRKYFNELLKDIENEKDFRKEADYNSENEIKNQYNGRQIFELLQNIDDQKSKNALIKLDTQNKTLLVANTGIKFSKEGLRSLLVANLSSKKSGTIGNKGLGFRSLLNWAKEIYIKSGELSIEFSEENRDKISKEKKRAILTCPEWIDEENKKEWIEKLEFFGEYVTYIVIHYKSICEEEIKKQINTIKEEVLLFINNIQEIEIEIDKNKKILKKTKVKIREKSGEITLKEYGEDVSKKYNIKIVLPEDNRRYDEETLYSYLPTNIRIGINALVHVTLELDSSRNTINDTLTNRKIIKELAKYIIEVAESLKEERANWKAYDLVKIYNNNKNELLEKFGFYEIIEEWKKTATIYPCINNKYCSKDEYYFYNNEFSVFLEKYPEVLKNFLKKNRYQIPAKMRGLNLTNSFNTISLLVKNIEERANFIKYILELSQEKEINIELNKLEVFTNQNNQIKKELILNEEKLSEIILPEELNIDFLNPYLQNKFSNKELAKFETIREIDIEKDLIDKIILMDMSLENKLRLLMLIFSKYEDFKIDWKNKNVYLDEIYKKYIYREDFDISFIFPKEEIVEKYEVLKNIDYGFIKKFIKWLGGKEASDYVIFQSIIKENQEKENIVSSIKKLFYIKDFLYEKYRNINEEIYIYNSIGEIKTTSEVFSFENIGRYDSESILANPKIFDLANVSKEKLKNFFKWIGVAEFIPENLAMDIIKKLREDDLEREKTIKLINDLYKLWFDENVRTQINVTDLKLLGKNIEELYIKNEMTMRYFPSEELIVEDLIFNSNGNIEEFYKWLGAKQPQNKTIIKKINQSNIELKTKLEDLYKIYLEKNVEFDNKEFLLLNQEKNLIRIENLYVESLETKYFPKSQKIGENYGFEKENEFLKWLGVNEPTSDEIANRCIELLQEENISEINLEERKEIIRLLHNVYYECDKDLLKNKTVILINKLNELEKSNQIYYGNQALAKYIPENIFIFDMDFDLEFIKWLKIKEIDRLKTIEILLNKVDVNYRDIFSIWNDREKENVEKFILKEEIKRKIKLLNRNNEYRKAEDLFLEKKETYFYTEEELIAEYKFFNLEDISKELVEKFFVWLGVNEYIKVETNNKIYQLNKIKDLDFQDLILLLEKFNFLSNEDALKKLREKFFQYKYWILKDYKIKKINPPVLYENDSEKIKILKEFGIKEDFDVENSLELLKELPIIDPEGEISNSFYKILVEKNIFIGDKEYFYLFSKDGKYILNKELYYLENTKVPKVIIKKYNFIDLPMNIDSKIVKNIFGINILPKIEYIVSNFIEAENSDIFYEYLDEVIPFFFCYGTLNKTALEKNKIIEEVKKVKSKINIGTFDCFAESEKIQIENYEMVFSNGEYYIKISKIEDRYQKNNTLTKSIENIFLNIFDDVEKFGQIFRYGDFEYLEEELNEKCGNLFLKNACVQLKNEKEKKEVNEFFEDKLKTNLELLNESEENLLTGNKIKLDYIEDTEKENLIMKIFDEKNPKQQFIQYDQNIFFERIEKINSKDKIDKENLGNTAPILEYNNREEKIQNLDKESNKNIFYNYNFSAQSYEEFRKKSGIEAENFIEKNFLYYKKAPKDLNGRSVLGYDFEYQDENKIGHFINVKNFKNKHFYVTPKEVEFILKAQKDCYHFYLVNINEKLIYDCIIYLKEIKKVK